MTQQGASSESGGGAEAWTPPPGLACPMCGYALGGAVGGACPECGQRVGPEDVELAVRRKTYLAVTAWGTAGWVGGMLALLAALLLLPIPKDVVSEGIALVSAAVGLGAAALLPRGGGLAPRAARRLWWSLWPLTQAGSVRLLAIQPVADWLDVRAMARGELVMLALVAGFVAVVFACSVVHARRTRAVAGLLGPTPTLRASRWTLATRLAMGVLWVCAGLSALGLVIAAVVLADRALPPGTGY